MTPGVDYYMGPQALHDLFLRTTGACTDTRAVPEGSMFFALKGPRFNANALASQALEQGARYAVIDEPEHVVDDRCILVEDVLTSLQHLARHHRQSLELPVLAITGSNGKTTTKELINAVMSASRPTLATCGNLNNHIGVPITLLQLRPSHRFAIIEMGANKPGDIQELMAIAEPTHGLITNIGRAHLEGFGGMAGVVRTKTEMYRWLGGHSGEVFVHADDVLLMEQSAGFRQRWTYGVSPDARTQGGACQDDHRLAFWFRTIAGARVEVRTQLVGGYNLPNALAAVAAGQNFGVEDALIVKAIEEFTPGNQRSQWVETGRNEVILDAYNANPTSVEAALMNLASTASSRPKLAVLGDMLELGSEGPAEHARIIRLCDDLGLPAVFVGPLFKHSAGGRSAYKGVAELMEAWSSRPPIGQLILLKGSRGMRMETLLPAL